MSAGGLIGTPLVLIVIGVVMGFELHPCFTRQHAMIPVIIITTTIAAAMIQPPHTTMIVTFLSGSDVFGVGVVVVSKPKMSTALDNDYLLLQ